MLQNLPWSWSYERIVTGFFIVRPSWKAKAQMAGPRLFFLVEQFRAAQIWKAVLSRRFAPTWGHVEPLRGLGVDDSFVSVSPTLRSLLVWPGTTVWLRQQRKAVDNRTTEDCQYCLQKALTNAVNGCLYSVNTAKRGCERWLRLVDPAMAISFFT